MAGVLREFTMNRVRSANTMSHGRSAWADDATGALDEGFDMATSVWFPRVSPVRCPAGGRSWRRPLRPAVAKSLEGSRAGVQEERAERRGEPRRMRGFGK